jgi:hypothetical protein
MLINEKSIYTHTLKSFSCLIIAILKHAEWDIVHQIFVSFSENLQSISSRRVFKGMFSVNKNSIFVFSVVDYPHPRRDLQRVPPTISKKFFTKVNGK